MCMLTIYFTLYFAYKIIKILYKLYIYMEIMNAKNIIDLITLIPIITLIMSIIYGFNLWDQTVCSGSDKDHGKCATKTFQIMSIVILSILLLFWIAGFISFSYFS